MDLLKIYIRYPDHESCMEHLESMRFGDEPFCLLCGGQKVARKADSDRIGRWNCHDCKASFNVLSGTIFQKTKIPLPKWFLAIGLILSAEKSISSYQLARDLDLNQKTAWYMAMRVRKAMQSEGALLQGIVEADDRYIGGKPRKGDKRDDGKPGKRGRGTEKMPVASAVKRGGSEVNKDAGNFKSMSLIRFNKGSVQEDGTLVVADKLRAYGPISNEIPQAIIMRRVERVKCDTHINSINGFWGLLERVLFGSRHKYSRKQTEASVHKACYRPHVRKEAVPFPAFIQRAAME